MAKCKLISILEIASWQNLVEDRSDQSVSLPALQRGAIWKPIQIENLWDSFFRGFPVGSFLMAPHEEGRGDRKLKYQSGVVSSDEKYHLLDGQQRSTAVALAFVNPWGSTDDTIDNTLWLDLFPSKDNPDRIFNFRILTRSHPWGFRLKPEANGSIRLSANEFRKASEHFRNTAAEMAQLRASQFPISMVWPWDSHAPVPMSLIIKAFLSGKIFKQELLSQLKNLPFWGSKSFVSKHGQIREKIFNVLKEDDENSHFNSINRALSSLIGKDHSYQIPVWILDVNEKQHIDRKSTGTSMTILNTPGTVLNVLLPM